MLKYIQGDPLRFIFLCVLGALLSGCNQAPSQTGLQEQVADENGAPLFQVDPFWPKTLPHLPQVV